MSAFLFPMSLSHESTHTRKIRATTLTGALPTNPLPDLQGSFGYEMQKSRFSRGRGLPAEQLLVQPSPHSHPVQTWVAFTGLVGPQCSHRAAGFVSFRPTVWHRQGPGPMRLVSRAWEAAVLPLNYTRQVRITTLPPKPHPVPEFHPSLAGMPAAIGCLDCSTRSPAAIGRLDRSTRSPASTLAETRALVRRRLSNRLGRSSTPQPTPRRANLLERAPPHHRRSPARTHQPDGCRQPYIQLNIAARNAWCIHTFTHGCTDSTLSSLCGVKSSLCGEDWQRRLPRATQ